MQCFNIIQRLVMTIEVSDESESNSFRMSMDCRERMLLLFGLVTQQEDLEEMVQIKVLQIIMMILDPKHTERMNKKFFNHVLVSCFQLYGSTSAMVKSTI